MKFMQNKEKKLVTYFIKECIIMPNNEMSHQDQVSVMKDFLYEALGKLSKKYRTKHNLQILFTGSKAKIMGLIHQIQVNCTNVDWKYLQSAQEEIRNQVIMNYETNKEQLWEEFDQKHIDQIIRKKMRKYVHFMIVDQQLKWKKAGRINMNRVPDHLMMESSIEQEPNSTNISSNSSILANGVQSGITEQSNYQQDFWSQYLVSLPKSLQLPIPLDSSMMLSIENEFLAFGAPYYNLSSEEEEEEKK